MSSCIEAVDRIKSLPPFSPTGKLNSVDISTGLSSSEHTSHSLTLPNEQSQTKGIYVTVRLSK